MRIISWNVNGLRACVKKGFLTILNNIDADIVGIQEVRAFESQLDPETRQPEGWHTSFFSAEKPRYSGVGFYSRQKPDHVEYGTGDERFDVEGRCIIAHFSCLSVINVYFPKGSGTQRANSRVPYKLAFYAAVYKRMQALRKRGPVYVLGDYNTAHQEIDLARPKTNHRNSGFLPEEHAVLDQWCNDGWQDTFRKLHPNEPRHYSWWRQWGDSRRNNVGWRIDYIFTSPSAQKKVNLAYILPEVPGSDHCPVGIDVDS